MRHYSKKRELVEYQTHITCDKCDKKIEGCYDDQFYEFDMERKEGSAYRDYQDYIVESLDLCRECSKELFDNMKAQGYKFQTREVDN